MLIFAPKLKKKEMAQKQLLVLLCLFAGVAACNKAPAPEPPEHPFTETELVKKHLEESMAPFFTILDIDSTAVKDPRKFIRDNSSVDVDWQDRGAVVYRLERNRVTALEARFYLVTGEVSAHLYGGVGIMGTISPAWSLDWGDWEAASDIKVYDQGTAVATLGYEPGLSTLVFRFSDGTSYALNSYLLSESLIDFIIENVLSTE